MPMCEVGCRVRRSPLTGGATFFGVMLATMIISLAAVPLMSTLIDQTRQTRLSETRIFANHLAQSMIERVKLEPYDRIKDVCRTIEEGALFVEQDPLLAPPDHAPPAYRKMLATFRRTVVFVEVSPRCGMVEAIVHWTEQGHYREVRLKTVVVDTFLPGGRP